MSEPIVPEVPGVPVYIRVGEGTEWEIGSLHEPGALPELLRAAADHAEQTINTSEES